VTLSLGEDEMTAKRILAALIFLVGAFIGASTRTDIWDKIKGSGLHGLLPKSKFNYNSILK